MTGRARATWAVVLGVGAGVGGCRTPPVVTTDAGPAARAAAEGDLARLEELVAVSGDVEDPSPTGYTPLMAAARNGHTEVVRWLLARGADPNAVNYGGVDVYWQATEGGHRDVQELLLAAGADSTGMGMIEPRAGDPVAALRATERGRSVVDLLALLSGLALGGAVVASLLAPISGRPTRAGAVLALGMTGGAGYYLTTGHWGDIRVDYLLVMAALAVVLAAVVVRGRRRGASPP